MRHAGVVCALLAAGFSLAAASQASATFPGRNGRLAVVWSDGACARQIVTMRTDGSRPRPVTSCKPTFGSGVDGPDWSGDGRRLVFERDGQLMLAKPDGTGQMDLQLAGSMPSFSPDGRRIAFVAPGRRIRVATTSGRVVRTLAKGFEPRWSPDGREIAYRTLRGIFVMDAVSGRRLRLIGPSVGSRIGWSPDGEWLTYTAFAPDRGVELWRIPTDGSGGARRLTRTDGNEEDAAWSPDGRGIAVVRAEHVSESVSYVISLITPAGRRIRTVARSSVLDSEEIRPPQLAWRPLKR